MSAKFRLSCAVVTTLAVVLGTALPGRSAASPPAAAKLAAAERSVELTWSAAYMASPHNYTERQAIQLAMNNDVVVGTPTAFTQYAAAMRRANPHLVLLAYSNAMFLPPHQAGGVPENEFAHDAAGHRIRSIAFGNYLMEPSNPQWRARAVSLCKAAAARSKADGCLLDMLTMAIFAKNYVSSFPIDPTTLRPYTEHGWQQRMVQVANEFTSRDSNQILIGNAITNASRYWDSSASSRPIAMALPAAQAEDFLRGSGDPVSAYPSRTQWLQNVALMRSMEHSGHAGFYSTKVWSHATSAQIADWQSYAISSFLMGAGGSSFFYFTAARNPSGVLGSDLPYAMPKRLGNPHGQMQQLGDVYYRQFSNGVSVVNPGDASVTVSFTDPGRDLAGLNVTKLTLPAHSGDVVVGKTGLVGAPRHPQKAQRPTSRFSKVSGNRHRRRLVGRAHAHQGVAHAYVAVRRLGTHKWLHRSGKLGHYQRIRVHLQHPHARLSGWSVALKLPKGNYRAVSIVEDRSGKFNRRPRTHMRFSVH